jgi:hypothetical protein
MNRIDFTVSQARKVVAACPPGSFYYSEAQRVLREHGTPARPVPGIDSYSPNDNDTSCRFD